MFESDSDQSVDFEKETPRRLPSHWKLTNVYFDLRFIRIGVLSDTWAIVYDPTKQAGLNNDEFRIWTSHGNSERAIKSDHSIRRPKSADEIEKAINGYAAFNYPNLGRPDDPSDFPEKCVSEVTFGDQTVYATKIKGRGLAVIDLARQKYAPQRKVIVWLAFENREISLYREFLFDLIRAPKSVIQTSLLMRGYAAFLNPELSRPTALDETPIDYVEPPEPTERYTDGYTEDSDWSEEDSDWSEEENEEPPIADLSVDTEEELDATESLLPWINYTDPGEEQDPKP